MEVWFWGREVYYACQEAEWCCYSIYSTAYAALRFTEAVCKGLRGEEDMMQCAYVHLPSIAVGDEIAETVDGEYFAVPMEFAVK